MTSQLRRLLPWLHHLELKHEGGPHERNVFRLVEQTEEGLEGDRPSRVAFNNSAIIRIPIVPRSVVVPSRPEALEGIVVSVRTARQDVKHFMHPVVPVPG